METLTVFGELLKPWIYAIVFKTATTSTWTGLTGRTHLWARILSQPKRSRKKNTPPWITTEIVHALRKKEAARSKLKKSPTDHQRQKYRELRTKAKILIRESREIYFSSLDSDLARQPKRFWSFFKLKKKTRTFPETMSSGDDNQQGPQASTPQQIAELFNSYFVSVFTAPSEIRTLSAHFTSSHPTLNELDIPVEMVLASLKQLDINKATGSDGIPVRLLR